MTALPEDFGHPFADLFNVISLPGRPLPKFCRTFLHYYVAGFLVPPVLLRDRIAGKLYATRAS